MRWPHIQGIVEFYERQQELGRVYTGPVLEYHRERARSVGGHLGNGPKRILELGAGGGQNAVALAELGHAVTAVEIVPGAYRHALTLARQAVRGSLNVIQGDFYDVSLSGSFDAVVYWDGFGIGTDADQRRLLRRVAGWLGPAGLTLLDVFTPWYWAAVAGTRQDGEGYSRQYGFDPLGCRMLDTWWAPASPTARVTQSLRCYSPADLELVLEGTGLGLRKVEPGGAYDQVARVYRPKVPLEQVMTYLAVLERYG